jgi:YesN/AraC family two-component response regulator
MIYSALSNLVITNVNLASTIYTPKNTKAKRVNRQRWAIIVKYEGETVYTVDNERFISDINNIVILPRGCSYEWECTEAGNYSVVEFESELSYSKPLSFHVRHGEKILKLVKEIEYKMNIRSFAFECEIIRDTYSIILSLVQSSSEKYVPNSKQQKLRAAIEYISQNYDKNITNDTLAQISEMSTVYFRKLFTEVMGTSPIAYARGLRIEKAKEILKSDYAALSDVAQALGYPNLYDFSRDFKKHTGVSPSKY